MSERIQVMWGIECPAVGRGGKPYLYPSAAPQRNIIVSRIERHTGESWAALRKRGYRAVRLDVAWDASA